MDCKVRTRSVVLNDAVNWYDYMAWKEDDWIMIMEHKWNKSDMVKPK